MADADDQFEDKPRKRRPNPDDDDAAGIKKPTPPTPPRRRPPERDRDDDDEDDRLRRRLRRESAPSDGGVGYVVPYRNWPALVAYYIGIICLLACFIPGLSLFTGIAAVVLGFMGFSRARSNPEAHGSAHAWIGIILGFVQILTGLGCGAWFIIMAATGGFK